MRIEFKKAIPYDITIQPSSNNGYIVKVGCSISVFTNKADLIETLAEYINNPHKIEKVYNNMNRDEPEVDREMSPNRPIPARGESLSSSSRS